jgi:exopolyphosphatase/guanosine-5'-triphosphate,3'-diphosphate pyrophosphatase
MTVYYSFSFKYLIVNLKLKKIMIIASIDIGTNTVLLLIAEVNVKSKKIITLLNEYRMPRIGAGINKTGIIKKLKIRLLYSVLAEYDKIIKKYQCEKVIVTGTNALRIAKNTQEISKGLDKLFNYKLEVIPGDTEAEYAFLGATSDLDNFSSSLVIDIGGGSTELIFGDKLKIISKRSIQIGSVSATEKFLKHSPPQKSEIEDLKKEIKEIFVGIKENKVPDLTIAVAGTATTLACMNLGIKIFEDDKIENSTISSEKIKNLIANLSKLTSIEILEEYGSVMKGREDIILAGAIILSEILESLGIKKLFISSKGIRYGAVIKYLNMSN